MHARYHMNYKFNWEDFCSAASAGEGTFRNDLEDLGPFELIFEGI